MQPPVRNPAESEDMAQQHTMDLQKLTLQLQAEMERRSQLARELGDQALRLQLALRAGRMGTWDWELTTGIVTLDEVELELLGLMASEEQLLVDAVFRQVDPEDLPALQAAVRRAIDDTGEYNHEFRVRHPAAGTRWLAGRGDVEFDAAGNAVRMRGINYDITERKRADEALRIRLRAIEFATNSILITDALAADNPIVYVNPAFEDLTGYRFDEVLGKNCRFLQGKETARAQVELIREAIRNRQECHTTILNYRKDGSRFWNDLHISPVEDDHGRVTNFVGIQSDITSRIRHERRLRESQEQANSANRAKSEFLANMSHEIRTPLTAILGCADSLFRQIEDPDFRDVVRMIRDQGQLLLGILNDVLDFSKIEAGKLEIRVEQFDLIRILGDVHSLMHAQAVEKGLELRTVYLTSIPDKIRTDPLRLRQILLNLVSNALKFTEKGYVEVQLSCRHDAENATLRIDVEDTGIGISSSRLHAIFEAFSQEKSRLISRVQGTGLGLTISQKLVQMLGGTISVTSNEGVGSRFTVELPLGEIDATQLKHPDEISRTAALRDSQMVLEFFIPCRVLIAEDTRGIQFMMTRMLKDAVTSVTVADNGLAVIAAVQQAEREGKPFDVILMDMQMPVMNGFDATRQLRAMGHTIPIIALTAGAMAGDRENCLAAGCNDYLPKPIDRVELLALVGQYGDS